MSYLKIDQNKIIEAPYIIEKNGKIIYGYNKEINQEMLFQDGYNKFNLPASCYSIKNNKITENESSNIISSKTIYTKLQIRRAMRQLDIQNKLNSILENNEQFKSDWFDAQEIDLNDPMIINALNLGLISQEQINRIKDLLG